MADEGAAGTGEGAAACVCEPQRFLTLDVAALSLHEVRCSCRPEKEGEGAGANAAVSQLHRWKLEGGERLAVAPDGGAAAVGVSGGVRIVRTSSPYDETLNLACGTVQKLYFSPRGTFLVVLLADGSVACNLLVHEARGGRRVASLGLRGAAAADQWPCVQWDSEEAACFIQVAGALLVFDGSMADFPKFRSELKIPGLQNFECAPTGLRVATFAAATEGRPAVVACYDVGGAGAGGAGGAADGGDADGGDGGVPTKRTDSGSAAAGGGSCLGDTFTQLNRKTFFQANSAKLSFSHDGSGVAVVVSSDTDPSGKSYYGGSAVHFLEASANGATMQFMSLSDGPVGGAAWHPGRPELLLAWGSARPRAVCFRTPDGRELLDFGAVKRNHLRFSPGGRLALLGGFGNLPGDVDVWDCARRRLCCSFRASCAVQCEFSPDARMLLCASTAPRMRVDNYVKIYRYSGELLADVPSAKLYAAQWVAGPEATAERAPSPGRSASGGSPNDVADGPRLFRARGAAPAPAPKPRATTCAAAAAGFDVVEDISAYGPPPPPKAGPKAKARRKKR